MEKLVEKSKLLSEKVEPEEVQLVLDLKAKMGPAASAAEVQRMAKQSNVDLALEDVETVLEIQDEMGSKDLSNAEIKVSLNFFGPSFFALFQKLFNFI
jgi:hypothetical protein